MNKQNWLGLALQLIQLILSALLKNGKAALGFMSLRR